MLSKLSVVVLAVAARAAPAPMPDVQVADVSPNVTIQGPQTFSAPAVHNPNFKRNGTLAMLKTYAKYNIKPTRDMPAAFMAALQKRQTGTAPADPDSNGVEYLVSTNVGGQNLNLDFDTGSSDLWVFSTSLSAASKKGHDVYDPSKSSTYKSLSGYKWSISYADGSGASGTVGTDTVKIGGTSVTGQAVELATKVSSTFVQDENDGLVGLAFDNINTVTPKSQLTYFTNVKKSLKSPLFAAYLPKEADGAYDFGYTDSTHYSGTIKYASVDSSNGFWEFSSPSYQVGSQTYSQSGSTAIADTGTTLIYLGDDAVDTYYNSVNGASYDSSQGGYTFPCSSTLPSLSVSIGSSFASISGSILNFGAVDQSGETCFGGLQSGGDSSQNIYGDVFLNANYGVFDSNGPRFGFAPLK